MEAFVKSSKSKTDKQKATEVSTEKTSAKLQSSQPWVEKYRPSTVDELASQEEVVAVLKRCALEGKDLPNFLFYGPPGTGKTSAILALAKQLFGPEIYRERVLELNASDERGIQVIREKVKAFAQYTASATTASGAPCLPLKIVILDEADCMTSSAQAALRRTMEKESRTTRFCLICNYVTRIIDPLTSRCAKFRFKPLEPRVQMQRLKYIAKKEKVSITDDALKCLIDTSDGDMRRAVTSLQSAARYAAREKQLTAEDAAELCGVLPDNMTNELFAACRRGRYDLMEKAVDKIVKQGYAAYDVMLKIHDRVVMEDEEIMSDLAKAKLLTLGCTMISALKK